MFNSFLIRIENTPNWKLPEVLCLNDEVKCFQIVYARLNGTIYTVSGDVTEKLGAQKLRLSGGKGGARKEILIWKKKMMLTFPRQHDVGIGEVWGCRAGLGGRDSLILYVPGKHLGHLKVNYQAALPIGSAKASRAVGLHPNLPKKLPPVSAFTELECPSVGVWVSNFALATESFLQTKPQVADQCWKHVASSAWVGSEDRAVWTHPLISPDFILSPERWRDLPHGHRPSAAGTKVPHNLETVFFSLTNERILQVSWINGISYGSHEDTRISQKLLEVISHLCVHFTHLFSIYRKSTVCRALCEVLMTHKWTKTGEVLALGGLVLTEGERANKEIRRE